MRMRIRIRMRRMHLLFQGCTSDANAIFYFRKDANANANAIFYFRKDANANVNADTFYKTYFQLTNTIICIKNPYSLRNCRPAMNEGERQMEKDLKWPLKARN